jgi:MFS family permease
MYIKRFFQLFSQPRIRRATVASSITMIGQQLCGINVLIQFSTTLFISADQEKSTSRALWISWGIGAINVVCGLPALWLIDRVGRRGLLLFLAPHLAWTMLVAGSGYLIPEGSESHLPLITAFSSLFVALYSSGQGVWAHDTLTRNTLETSIDVPQDQFHSVTRQRHSPSHTAK